MLYTAACMFVVLTVAHSEKLQHLMGCRPAGNSPGNYSIRNLNALAQTTELFKQRCEC